MVSAPLPLSISFILVSLSEAKLHMNECRECVWESIKSGLVPGSPSQTQQGAGGGVKNTRAHLFNHFLGSTDTEFDSQDC